MAETTTAQLLPPRLVLQDRLAGVITAAGRGGYAVGLICYGASDDSSRLEFGIADWSARTVGDPALVAVMQLNSHGFAVFTAPLVATGSIQPLYDALWQNARPGLAPPDHAGLALYPDNALEPDALLAAALAAESRARADGLGLAVAPPLAPRTPDSAQELTKSLSNGELRLVYLPQVDVADGRITTAEALVRLHPPDGTMRAARGAVLAADGADMDRVGLWVLDQAARDAVIWRAAGLGRMGIAVNMSLARFRKPGMAEAVATAVSNSGLHPDALEIELTEHEPPGDLDLVASELRRLRSFGIRLALDDFGTGFASASLIEHLPLDVLKIDKSYVAGLGHGSDGEPIVQAAVELGRSHGLVVVAEGVEEPDQLAHVRRLGCDRYQGYLFSQPLPAAELAGLAARN